jgi:hypothetical protein
MGKLLTDAEVEEIRQQTAQESRSTRLREWIDRLLEDRDERRALERKDRSYSARSTGSRLWGSGLRRRFPTSGPGALAAGRRQPWRRGRELRGAQDHVRRLLRVDHQIAHAQAAYLEIVHLEPAHAASPECEGADRETADGQGTDGSRPQRDGTHRHRAQGGSAT